MKPRTLSTFEVHPKDIASGYANTEIWELYQRVTDYLESGLSCRQAADLEGLLVPASDPAYKRFSQLYYHWGKTGRLPESVEAVANLHKLGIFPGKRGYAHQTGQPFAVDMVRPFVPSNSLFRQVGLFSSIQFLSGDLNQENDHTSISGRCPITMPEVRRFMGAVMDDYQPDPDKPIRIKTFQSRLLAALGNIVGHQNETDILLPRIPLAALNSLKAKDSSQMEKQLARTVLKDFVLAYFGLGQIHPFTDWQHHAHGYIRLLPSEEAAIKRADLLVEIFEQADFGAEVRKIGPYNPASERYNCELSIEFEGDAKEEIEKLQKKFRTRLNYLATGIEKQRPPHLRIERRPVSRRGRR